MLVKIRVSYNTTNELNKVLKLLKPIVLSCKVAKTQKGVNKKAYIEVKND